MRFKELYMKAENNGDLYAAIRGLTDDEKDAVADSLANVDEYTGLTMRQEFLLNTLISMRASKIELSKNLGG